MAAVNPFLSFRALVRIMRFLIFKLNGHRFLSIANVMDFNKSHTSNTP